MRPVRLILLTLAVALALVPAAHADVATDIRNELVANGVPNPTISVTTPTPATAADAAAYQNDPSGSYASINALNILSPDPSNPRPIVNAYFSPSSVTSLPGVVTPPGQPGVYIQDAQSPIWTVAVMEAVKHANAGGAGIAGVALRTLFGSRGSSTPDVYIATPDAADLTPTPNPGTLPTAAVQLNYQLGLPQRYSGATVTATDAAGGQRLVTITLNQSATAFQTENLSGLVDYAETKQAELNAPLGGGNVGQVVVVSRDPATQNPLFTYSGDVSWGQKAVWSSPAVAAFVNDGPTSG